MKDSGKDLGKSKLNGVELRHNFFDQDELKAFVDKINFLIDTKDKVDPKKVDSSVFKKDFNDFYLDRNLGRIRINLKQKDIPYGIIRKLNEEAQKINPDLELGIISFIRYDKQYGFVQLIPHYDKPSRVQFLFDIQVNSNVQWPLVVAEHGEYNMVDNDILILDVTKKIHWRKPQVFEDGQFLDLMFVTFNNKNMEIGSADDHDSDVKPYYDAYKEYADSIYPPYMHKCYQRILKVW